ncbi:MAG: hypothetical protein HKN43_07775 [Rhodothermales bacterium]|nr:hypothetical protein [Rhodothermales bacterium]
MSPTYIGLVRLTFRELWARWVTLGLFIVSTLAWLMVTFALNIDVVEGSLAGFRVFGDDVMPTDVDTDPSDLLNTIVVTIQAAVAGAAYWVAALLGLFATGPILASSLEPGRSGLLFSKPAKRSTILNAHTTGVVLVAALITVYLLGMVFLVMSLKSGIWNFRFLLAIPLVVTMFSVMYSVMVLVTVISRSSALSLIITYGLIFSSIVLAAKDEIAPQITLPWRNVYLGFYHVIPKFAEVTRTVAQLAGIEPVNNLYPLASSVAFGLFVYTVAVFVLKRQDL